VYRRRCCVVVVFAIKLEEAVNFRVVWLRFVIVAVVVVFSILEEA
jgi:hypothetical protein